MTMSAAHDEEVWLREVPPPARPLREHRHSQRVGLVASMHELWRSRGMIRSLAERDMRARYKQTYLGIAWAVITPFMLLVVFALFFKGAADIDTGSAPYTLFAYLGLLPWGFFSTSMSQGGVSLVNNVPLLNKVYCPREVFPLGSVCLAIVDTSIALPALAILFLVEGYTPHLSLYLPVLFAVQLAFTVGAVLITSSVIVYLRDLRTTLPMLLQLGLFATPVAYGLESIPSDLKPLYAAVNPLVSVIDGYRQTVLHGKPPDLQLLSISAATASVTLLFGYWVFKRLEGGIADVA